MRSEIDYKKSQVIYCSIIIPHYSQALSLRKCLTALENQDTLRLIEVIVVDNGSPNFNLEAWSKDYPKVIWLKNNVQKNPYTSRNIAAARAKGVYFAFMDAKCQPQASCLSELFAICGEKDSIVAGQYRLNYQSDALRDKVYGMLYLNNEKNILKGYGVTSGNLIVHRKIFNAVGPFRDSAISGNDIEWSLRALNFGFTIAYAPKAIIDYPAQSWNALSSSIKKYAAGVALIDQKKKTMINAFLPLRLSTFTSHLTNRNLRNMSIWDKSALWVLTWIMKIKYALALVRSRKS